ncbi:MAG: hypothetical protein KDB63_14585 [Nocardioidaceae bacterium]|nr:hypothetical protein [Nocardioidaceae bacterium]
MSRDKFLTSGQQLAVSGEVVGYYVFSRDETKRPDATHERQQVDHRTTAPNPAIPVRRRRSASEIEPLSPLAD